MMPSEFRCYMVFSRQCGRAVHISFPLLLGCGPKVTAGGLPSPCTWRYLRASVWHMTRQWLSFLLADARLELLVGAGEQPGGSHGHSVVPATDARLAAILPLVFFYGHVRPFPAHRRVLAVLQPPADLGQRCQRYLPAARLATAGLVWSDLLLHRYRPLYVFVQHHASGKPQPAGTLSCYGEHRPGGICRCTTLRHRPASGAVASAPADA